MFFFRNLDEKTRRIMLEELEMDIDKRTLYISERLNGDGKKEYPNLLREAIESGNEQTLANSLKDMFNEKELRKNKSVKIPRNANIILAEGEFNKFYIRAICIRALEEGKKLRIYRAKEVKKPRNESNAKIGEFITDPQKLLSCLRDNNFECLQEMVPTGPNSGLSVELVD